jgi:hypothetical protein
MHWNTKDLVIDTQQSILSFCRKSVTGRDLSPSTSSVPRQLPLHKCRTFIRLLHVPSTKDPLAAAVRKNWVSSYLKDQKDHFEETSYEKIVLKPNFYLGVRNSIECKDLIIIQQNNCRVCQENAKFLVS